MVCIACLLPLFLVPIVNLLPLIFDRIMAKIYGLMGWEYRKPERAPPACPYKPVAQKDNTSIVGGETVPGEPKPAPKQAEITDTKED